MLLVIMTTMMHYLFQSFQTTLDPERIVQLTNDASVQVKPVTFHVNVIVIPIAMGIIRHWL